jgi:arabinogalactan endo-1,4-beta-galactosidase
MVDRKRAVFWWSVRRTDHTSNRTIISVIVNGGPANPAADTAPGPSTFMNMAQPSIAESIWGRIVRRLRSKTLLCAQAAVLWWAGSTIAGAQSMNLLSNASFENGSTEPWQVSHGSVTQTDSVEGMRALALSPGGAASQQVLLSPGVYELRAFVRPAVKQTAQLRLACQRGPQSEVSSDTPDPSSPAPVETRDTDWRELHAPVFFLPHSASCRVTIQVSGDVAASTVVDSLSLTRHQNLLVNPELLHKQKKWKVVGAPRVPGPPLHLGESGTESWLSQTVYLPPGSYTLSASYRSSGGQSLARLEANGCGPLDAILNLAPALYGDAYRRLQLRGIRVNNASCTVGLRVRGAAGHLSEQWLRVSDLTLEPDAQSYEMIAGGDVSLTDMVEEHGGIYKLDGVPADPFYILARSGMNLARLHLFVDSGNPAFSPSRGMQGSYDNLAGVLHLAARAHSAGMRIELSLHLSDYWADGDCQTMAHAWLGLSAGALVDMVSDYIGSVVGSFNERGIPLDYVAIGNEADAGLLRTLECKSSSLLPVNADVTTNPDLLSRIYEGGYRAVHASSPHTLVLWHLANIGRYAETRRYIDAMFSRGAQVDVLAYSAYPFWSHQTVRQFQDFANYVTARYHRPVFFEETGYLWAPASGADNMNNGGPEPYPLTPRGQLDFLNDEIGAIQSADEGGVIGFSYWDATWIPAPHTFDNVDNYVLFDRAGNALPALTTGFRLRPPQRFHWAGDDGVIKNADTVKVTRP